MCHRAGAQPYHVGRAALTAKSPTMGFVAQHKTRRRLETEDASQSHIGRGCLIWGGVLGIVVGGMFAAYGLKPILKHFYGEQTVAWMATYSGGGKELSVTGVAQSGGGGCAPTGSDPAKVTCVTLRVVSDKEWEGLNAGDFTLQVSNQHDWLDATSIVGHGTSPVRVTANVPMTVVVHFPVLAGGAADDAEYLHLTSPRLRFALHD